MDDNKKFLLIGNSRLHWAEKIKNNYVFTHSKINKLLLKDTNLENLIWASVGNFPTEILKKENEIITKKLNIQNLPHYFGIDRALGAFAALKTFNNPMKKNLLIADCGTTLSITKISSNGVLIGGQLIPGFSTQLKSMELSTNKLEAPTNQNIPKKDFLLDTKEAMIKGVTNSILGAILMAFNHKEDFLIICGGDAELIGSLLKTKEIKCKIQPNLVMLGMIFFSKYN